VKTRVLLADDHALVRAGFRSLLEKIRFVKVVAEAEDGREAVELVRKHRPDVALIDIAMPKLNGLEAIARVTKEFPNMKVIVLSMYANQEYVVQAMQMGARGYLVKEDVFSELKAAIKGVTRGEVYVSPSISQHVTDYLERADVQCDPLAKLTPRQREILQLLAEGNSTKEIAFSLGLSGKTVDAHRSQVMKKLHIRDLFGLVRYAMRIGLVPTEGPAGRNIQRRRAK
jgi:DNA-binding NarL/FixJ family response regulator